MDEAPDKLDRLRGRLAKPSPERMAELEARSAAAEPELQDLVERIASGEGDIYAHAHQLYRRAMTATAPTGADGERATVLWLLWAAFDDVAERVSARTPELENAMRAAAEEWLTIRDDNGSMWRPYLDRWRASIQALRS